MLAAIRTTLTAAGIGDPVQRLAADSGYWSIANVSAIPDAPELLIPPVRHGRHGKPRKDGKPSESKSDNLRAAMLATITSEHGKVCYAQRSRTIEPVFGQSRPFRAASGSCAGSGGLCGRVEAAVRHPQPAQALAHDHSHQPLTGTNHQAPPLQDRTDHPHRRHEQFSGHARGLRRRHCATGSYASTGLVVSGTNGWAQPPQRTEASSSTDRATRIGRPQAQEQARALRGPARPG